MRFQKYLQISRQSDNAFVFYSNFHTLHVCQKYHLESRTDTT